VQITKNKVVTIDYTLTDTEGRVLDTSAGAEPLAYLHGVGGLIPGLEGALEGHNPGDKFAVDIPPDQAYGERDESLVQAVSRQQFVGVDDLAVGMQFEADTEAGPRIVTVVDIQGDSVMVDGNHELAGVPLHFDIEVTGVRDATPDELRHGHVHGPGGHHH
jgi:FKBP-type peptidyl-prolyl cis-trans isomerase SlyD